MYHEYFLPFCVSPFNFINGDFQRAEAFNFVETQLTIFSL